MQLKTQNLSFKILFSTLLVTCVYACYSSGPILNKDEPKESFPLKVIGNGPSTQTWIGDNGKTYTMKFGEPIFKITESTDK